MKKITAFILTLAMVLGLGVSVFATEPTTGSITVTNAAAGETYKLYKIFDLTYKPVENASPSAIAYTFTKTAANSKQFDALNDSESPFDLEETTTPGLYTVSSDVTDGAVIGEWLKSNPDALGDEIIGKQTANGKFTGLDFGYYFISTSLGTLVTIDSTIPNANVLEKNEAPELDKVILEGEDEVKENNANIGDTIDYQITITAQPGADSYVLKDTLGTGLSLDTDSITVVAGNDELAEDDEFTLDADESGFTMEFDQDYLDSISATTEIVITYSAVVNKGAVIDGEGNTNTAKLTYGDHDSIIVFTRTYVYSITINKIDGESETEDSLDGAKFELYDAEEGGNKINLVKVEDGLYRKATAEEVEVEDFESAIVEAGTATIKGLAAGNYYIEEVDAPKGYNPLTARQEVSIEDESVEIDVKNFAGSILPSTGGIGTTIFYVLGSIMLLGAAVMLVTKRRMDA